MKPQHLLVVIAVAGLTDCVSQPEQFTGLSLVWEDNFGGQAGELPNPANWRFHLGTNWGNNELQCYTDRSSNASLDGAGHLVMTALAESYSGPASGIGGVPCTGTSYTSARIATEDLHSWKQGRFEARIKIPVSRGIWPAFWMLGADLPQVGWPRAGEIDIMENFGREPNQVQGTLHGPGPNPFIGLTRVFDLGARFDADFHTFAVEWSSERINWYVDSTLYQTIKPSYQPGESVLDHPYYLILNLAVGGGPPGPPDGSTSFPQTMAVDWVRVYQQ